MRKKILIVVAVLLALGGAYFAQMMLPRGALEGVQTEVPSEWSGVNVPDVVELETNPTDPYSVKIWVVPVGDRMYVHAGDNYNQWVQNIEKDPSVRLLVEDQLYTLHAGRVTSAEEFAGFAQVYELRYDRRPRNENVDEVYLFRMTAGS